MSNLECFGDSQTGRLPFILRFCLWIDPWRETLKEGLSYNALCLVQYLLTLDLRVETCFTIDSGLRHETCFTAIDSDLRVALHLTVDSDKQK